MGNYFRAQQKLKKEYKDSVQKNKKKFKKADKRRVLFIGPPDSGKTLLFNALLDIDDKNPSLPYEPTERIQLGLKIVNPKDYESHPVSFRFIDTPGSMPSLKRGSLFAFQKVDLIMILIDASKKIDEQQIRDWSLFCLSQVYQYHRASAVLKNLTPSEMLPSESDSLNAREGKGDEQSSYNHHQHHATFGQMSARMPDKDFDRSHQIFVDEQKSVGLHSDDALRGGGILDEQDDFYDIYNESTKKQALPEIIHVFTKRDRMGYEGFKRQVEVIEGLKNEGIIDKYFFVSPVSQYGINELRQYVLNMDNFNMESTPIISKNSMKLAKADTNKDLQKKTTVV